jgi:hypothetical protein
MAPEGVSVHVARVPLVDTRTYSNPPHPDDAIALLAALPMKAIVFAFTTTSYILGPDGEQELKVRLEKHSNGIPVLLTGTAAVAGFRALGVRRVALIHPPWFADDENQLGPRSGVNSTSVLQEWAKNAKSGHTFCSSPSIFIARVSAHPIGGSNSMLQDSRGFSLAILASILSGKP